MNSATRRSVLSDGPWAFWGGTLGQLLIPLVVTVAFWRQRDALGFAVGGFWFFENFLDVAVYMADAKSSCCR